MAITAKRKLRLKNAINNITKHVCCSRPHLFHAENEIRQGYMSLRARIHLGSFLVLSVPAIFSCDSGFIDKSNNSI